MKLEITSNGSFKNTTDWLTRLRTRSLSAPLNEIGRAGVAALQGATPKRSGETASHWTYKVKAGSVSSEVAFFNNSHPETTASIPILIQYGHGTRNGGYVPGYDFINPAMRSVFNSGVNKITKEMLK